MLTVVQTCVFIVTEIILFTPDGAATDGSECRPSLVFAATGVTSLILHDLQTSAQNLTGLTPSLTLRNANAITADHVTGLLFFADANLNAIYKKNYKTHANAELVKSLPRLTVAEKLAVDTDLGHIFYTDSGLKQLVRIDYDGGNEQILLREADNLHRPMGILLHKQSSKLYYTDWGTDPHISRADVTGENPEVVVDSDLVTPNALTSSEDKLYWCDGINEAVYSINWDGSGRVRELYEPGSTFFDILLVGDIMYTVASIGFDSKVLRLALEGDNRPTQLVFYDDIRVNSLTYICFPTSPVSLADSTTTTTTLTTTTTASTTASSNPLPPISSTTSTPTPGIADQDSDTTPTAIMTSSTSLTSTDPSSGSSKDGGGGGSDNTLIIAVSIAAGALLFGILIVSVTVCVKKRKPQDKRMTTKTAIPTVNITGRDSPQLPPCPPVPLLPGSSPKPLIRNPTYLTPRSESQKDEKNPYEKPDYEKPVDIERNPYLELGGNTTSSRHTYIDVRVSSDNRADDVEDGEIYLEIDDKNLDASQNTR